MSIPKKIHYCWFGRNPKPKLAEKCLRSWKKFCPDYEIIQWDEDNYDLSQTPLYVQQAYAEKKWAFVTDYVRLDLVFREGGIYLDTDVELLKPLDSLLSYHAYFGFERPGFVATGLGFGAEQGAEVIREMMEVYDTLSFRLPDGSFNQTPCPEYNTPVLQRRGLNLSGDKQVLPGNILVLSREYLCPMDYETGECKKTQNTVSVHWFSASWKSQKEQKEKKSYIRRLKAERLLFAISRLPNKIGMAVFGENRYVEIRAFLKGHK